MAQVHKYGPMVPSMKVNGRSTRPTERESFGMLMGTSMRATGKMIKLMASVFTFTLTGLAMRDNGRTISRMAGVLRAGLMAASTRVATRKA